MDNDKNIQVMFYGHACFGITYGEHRIIIDPYILDNPSVKHDLDDIVVDWILVTHAHHDHFGDAIALAKKNDATIIANYELSKWCNWQGVEKTHTMYSGGKFEFPFGTVHMTPAIHGSGLEIAEEKYFASGGNAAGFLLQLGNFTLYHAGDTALFSDMRLIGKGRPIDIAILPIGDNVTMGPDEAVLAAEFLDARKVIPCHYDTWDEIKQDPEVFKQKLEKKGIKALMLSAGDVHVFHGS